MTKTKVIAKATLKKCTSINPFKSSFLHADGSGAVRHDYCTEI